jgi:hypothetical protein
MLSNYNKCQITGVIVSSQHDDPTVAIAPIHLWKEETCFKISAVRDPIILDNDHVMLHAGFNGVHEPNYGFNVKIYNVKTQKHHVFHYFDFLGDHAGRLWSTIKIDTERMRLHVCTMQHCYHILYNWRNDYVESNEDVTTALIKRPITCFRMEYDNLQRSMDYIALSKGRKLYEETDHFDVYDSGTGQHLKTIPLGTILKARNTVVIDERTVMAESMDRNHFLFVDIDQGSVRKKRVDILTTTELYEVIGIGNRYGAVVTDSTMLLQIIDKDFNVVRFKNVVSCAKSDDGKRLCIIEECQDSEKNISSENPETHRLRWVNIADTTEVMKSTLLKANMLADIMFSFK